MVVDVVEVDRLLTLSRAAHAAYRQALGGRGAPSNPAAARDAIQEAFDYRKAAQEADPMFEAPAWAAESGTHPHVALMLFYRQELAK